MVGATGLAAAAGSPQLRLFVGVLFGLLATATGIVAVVERTREDARVEEVKTKIRSWWIIAGLMLFATLVAPGLSFVWLGFVSYLALREYFTLVPTHEEDRGAILWSYLTIPVHFYWMATGWYAMAAIFIPVYVFLLLPARQVVGGETRDFVARTARIAWGTMLFVYCLGHAGLLLSLGPVGSAGIGGRELFLFLVFLTALGDVGGWTFGRAFGKERIVPTVSPNKTWAGFAGSVLTCAVVAVLMRFLTPFGAATAALVGAGLGVAGFFGDVTVSAVKRDVGVKDASELIPGHGGMLDRIDSLCYTAPLFLHFVRYFYY